MKVTVIPIVIGAKINKGSVKGLENFKSEDKWRPLKLQN